MKIVRAAKEVSRIAGEIKEIKHRIQNCISTLEGNEYPEWFSDLFNTLNEQVNKLARLKTAIHSANVKHDMYKHIVRIGELKQYLVFLKELDPKVGKHEKRYGDTIEQYISQITVAEKNDAIQATEKAINEITDILDKFNAETDIGEVEEIVLSLPEVKKNS